MSSVNSQAQELRAGPEATEQGPAVAAPGGIAGRLGQVADSTAYRRARPFLPWLVCGVVLVLFANSATAYTALIAGTVLIYSISAIGLNVLMGQAGLVSIGNAALMAVGAYTTAILAPKHGWGTFPVPFIASAIVGGVVGLVIALPALRLRGIYLALATLALQFFVSFAGDRYQADTGAISGVSVPALTIGGYSFTAGAAFTLLLGAFLGLTVLVVRAISRHAPGRTWNALRESELAATAIGVNAARWKLAAFVVSSSIIAASGSLLAYYNQIVSADSFSLEFAVTFIVILILGGMGTISGAIVGSIVVVSLPFLLTKLTAALPPAGIGSWFTKNIFYINNGLYGILVLVVLLYLPEGLVPALGKLSRWILARTARPLPGQAAPAKRPAPTESAEERAGQKERSDRAALLEVAHVNVTYQTGARAVADLNLRVEPHAIVAVLGRNGAGKTSALRAISGFLVAEQVKLGGRIEFDGRNVLGGSPTKTAAQGLVLVPERDKIFPSLTVQEHLKLAGPGRIDQVIERPYFNRLKDRSNQPAGLLSGGERQLLALATASLLEPRLLMVDEFTLGLAPVMIQEVARVIRGLRDDGMTILLVEQNAAAALELANWVYLMEGGEVVAEGAPDDMADRVTMTAQAAR